MKITKKILTVMLSFMMVFPYMQAVSASENLMNILLEDVTDSADTLAGEAKVKVSVKGIDGSITLSQLKFDFSGNGSFKSIAYSDEINKLVKSSGGGQPFFVQPIDIKRANKDGKFDFAFSGGTKYSLPVSAGGTELCTITFEGEPEKDITLSLNDLENSFCVISPNILSPKTNAAEAVSLTVKFSNTTNVGVKATVNVKLDELKESGGFSDASDIILKFTNLTNNQVRTFALADAEKIDAVSYRFIIDGLVAGNYDIELVGDGFVSKKIENTEINSDMEFGFNSERFYAGDVYADSKLTLSDYNRFVSMYEAKAAPFNGIDYNRDGKLSEYDLLAMITSVKNHIEPGEKGETKAVLKAKASAESVKKDDTFTVTLALDAGDEKVNSYYIKGTYPEDVAKLINAECMETSAANMGINTAEKGKFTFLNKISDGTKKELYKLTFKAVKSGTFRLSFLDTEGALFYDVNNDLGDRLLNISFESGSVEVSDTSSTGGGSTGGGGGGGGIGGGASSPTMPVSPATDEGTVHEAYVTGYEDNTIRPDINITRAEAAAMISRISKDFDAGHDYDISMFNDTENGAWYAKNVGYAAEKGIVNGYEDGSFRPDESITREEFAAMACRFMNYETTVGESFSDVPDDHWAKAYIDTMKAKGIVGGYEDGTFGLGKEIVRAEVITIINRMNGRTPNEEKAAAYVQANGYPASDIEGHWAAAQMLEASVTHKSNELH